MKKVYIDDPGTRYSIPEIEKLINLKLPSSLSRSDMLFYTDYDDGGPDYICALKVFGGNEILKNLIEDESWENRGADEYMLESIDGNYRPKWWRPIKLTEYNIYFKQGAGEMWELAYGTSSDGRTIIYLLYIEM